MKNVQRGSILGLIITAMLALPSLAKFTYLCRSLERENLPFRAGDEASYQACGLDCYCHAMETLCFTKVSTEKLPDTGSVWSFDVRTSEYANECTDCICNVNTIPSEWKEITMSELGMESPLGL